MPATHEIVASRVDGFLGASVFDEALFDHFAAQIETKYGEGERREASDLACSGALAAGCA